MDINTTAIERNLRLFTQPGLLTLGGILGMLLLDPNGPAEGVTAILAQIQRIMALVAAGAAFVGSIWLAYRAWLAWRWETGSLEGGCSRCSGVMRHLGGKYADYSKCLMCGLKREGHY